MVQARHYFVRAEPARVVESARDKFIDNDMRPL
jgi:hypothetical protein